MTFEQVREWLEERLGHRVAVGISGSDRCSGGGFAGVLATSENIGLTNWDGSPVLIYAVGDGDLVVQESALSSAVELRPDVLLLELGSMTIAVTDPAQF